MTDSVHAQKLTREQEVEFSAQSAAFFMDQMNVQEKKIAALPKKKIAVFAAAGLISRLAQQQKETGKYDQQQFTFILSTVLYRLSQLSQAADMPPMVTACHLAEARNLENSSKGLPPVAANCREKAYGQSIQSESIIELSRSDWASNHDLLRNWVASAFSYAQNVAKITNYGASSVN